MSEETLCNAHNDIENKAKVVRETRQRLRQTEEELKTAKETYHQAILDILGTDKDQPLEEHAEGIFRIAQAKVISSVRMAN